MRNLILVTLDSLRADHCSYWGYDRETTPTLDRMAESGLTFLNAVSPGPSTPESMPVSFTGRYPVRRDRREDESLLAARRATIRRHMHTHETLAERFSRLGYATAGFSPNPYTSRYFGFDAGFDRYEDFMGGSRERLYRGMLDGVLEETALDAVLPVRLLLNWVQREEVFKPWAAFQEDLLAWLSDAPEPYFLWVLLMDTHDPYLVPGEYRTQSRRAMYRANYRLWRQGHEPPFSRTTHRRLVRAYDDSVRYGDAFLDRIATEAPGDPLIAVHGDHGEAFGEHGTYGHHQQLYAENVHVPFVVAGGPDREIAQPVSLGDLPGLLSDVAVRGTVPTPDGPAVSRTLDERRVSLRGRRWACIANGTTDELYTADETSTTREERRVDDERLGDELRRLIRDRREHDRERNRIRTATDRLPEVTDARD